MKEQIKQIFETNRTMIQLLDDAVYNFRRQNLDVALRTGILVINKLTSFIPEILKIQDLLNETGIVQIEQDSINQMLTEILDTQEKGDYVLLGDLYELKLEQFLSEIQQALFQLIEETPFVRYSYEDACKKIIESDEKLGVFLSKKSVKKTDFEEFSMEYCTNGDITAARILEGRPYYLHSNHKPVEAGMHLAWSWYKPQKTQYLVFGLGLGYHAEELGKIDETIEIIVYEPELKMIQLAAQYGVLIEFLENPKHRIVYDPELNQLYTGLKNTGLESEFVVHYPTLQGMKEGTLKEKMENYFLQYSSIENQIRLMHGNFRENIKNVPECISKMRSQWEGKTAYIIAAGPSLDKNMEELKKVSRESVVIAVGTVFRKMKKENIPIDYVIVSDANERVIGQIYNLEQEQTPLLILSTAYHGFAEKYQGPKYLIFQEGLEESEEEAEKRGAFLCKTGGSVTIVALDLCAKMGISKIVTVGLDLAYTDNFVHARDTSRRHISDIKHLRLRNDIYGREIYTTKSMDKYRVWIENWIEEQKYIEFINATEGGVNIKGMKNAALKDVVD